MGYWKLLTACTAFATVIYIVIKYFYYCVTSLTTPTKGYFTSTDTQKNKIVLLLEFMEDTAALESKIARFLYYKCLMHDASAILVKLAWFSGSKNSKIADFECIQRGSIKGIQLYLD